MTRYDNALFNLGEADLCDNCTESNECDDVCERLDALREMRLVTTLVRDGLPNIRVRVKDGAEAHDAYFTTMEDAVKYIDTAKGKAFTVESV